MGTKLGIVLFCKLFREFLAGKVTLEQNINFDG